ASFAGGKMWEGSPEQLRLAAHDLDTFHFVRKSQEKLAAFLDRYGHKKPIFIWWAPLLPHKHHNAPERFFERVDLSTITVPEGFPEEEKDTYRRAEQAFLATIAWVDEEVGKLIQSLEDQGLMDNTWILVLSDNGWSNLYPAKGAPYDIGVRTPLILQGPDVEPGISDKLVSTQNLYGSILQLAGLEVAGNRKETLDIFSVAKQHKNDALLNTPYQV